MRDLPGRSAGPPDPQDGTIHPCRRVVGAYRDVAVFGLSEGPLLSVAYPTPPDAPNLRALVVRSEDGAENLASRVREAVQAASPAVRFVQVSPLSERFERLLGPWRLGATLFGAFAALALAVAVLGLYAILAFGVAEQLRELEIWGALGASRRDLVAMVVARVGRLVGWGLVLGTVAALVGGRFLEGLLFGVGAGDPAVLAFVVVAMAVAGGLAAVLPARRAASVEPTTAMRTE